MMLLMTLWLFDVPPKLDELRGLARGAKAEGYRDRTDRV